MTKPKLINIEETPRLNDHIKEVLKERLKSKELQVETIIEKIQSKLKDVFGPLANESQYLEGSNAVKDETVDVNMERLFTCTQETILLLGQSLYTMAY